jgi:small ligand-binding sensory domain FIST
VARGAPISPKCIAGSERYELQLREVSSALLGRPDHDVGAVRRAFGHVPVAGYFAAGEIGPVAGKNFLHGFTASILFFCEA